MALIIAALQNLLLPFLGASPAQPPLTFPGSPPYRFRAPLSREDAEHVYPPPHC